MGLRQVDVGAVAPDRLAALLSPWRRAEPTASGARLRVALGGRALVCIGKSRTGTGVADLTEAVTAARGLGIQARWFLPESGRDAGADTASRRHHEPTPHAIRRTATSRDQGPCWDGGPEGTPRSRHAGGLAGVGNPARPPAHAYERATDVPPESFAG